MLKICHVCGQEKEHKSWKATTCNSCLAQGYKGCSCCCTSKPLSAFHKNGSTIRSFCKPCECKRSLDSKNASGYQSRPEVRVKRNESSRLCKRAKYLLDEEYRNAELVRCHNRRNNTDGNITTEQWHKACGAFNFTCAYCGQERKLTMDHVIAVNNGGTTDVTNIIPACQSCNSSKQDKDLIEWYTKQPFYSKYRLENIIKYIKGVTPCQR